MVGRFGGRATPDVARSFPLQNWNAFRNYLLFQRRSCTQSVGLALKMQARRKSTNNNERIAAYLLLPSSVAGYGACREPLHWRKTLSSLFAGCLPSYFFGCCG